MKHVFTDFKRRTYVDNVIYNDGQPVYIGLEEGYYANGEYFTTLRDYQGSICMVLKTTGSTNGAIEILERNYLDPWGVEFGMASDVFGVQPFKHQGKERIEFAGNYTHDHGARMAHNAIGRWSVKYLSEGAPIGLLAHEAKHAYQFEMGNLDLGRKYLYDQTDEAEAYQRGSLFGEAARNKEWINTNYLGIPEKAVNVQIWNTSPNIFPNPVLKRNADFGRILRYHGTTYSPTPQ